MDATTLIDHLAADGVATADTAARSNLDAAVPGLEWTLRDVVVHLGGVHRWAAEIVRTGSDTTQVASGAAIGAGPSDDQLIDWFLTGHAELVAALGDAPADLQAVAFLPADSPLHFWARRQAHETAIHRVDIAGAAGETCTFDPDFAQDGLTEMFGGFARRRRKEPLPGGSMSLIASDGPSWLVEMSGDRVSAVISDSEGDVVLSGTSSELYRWVWNRPADVVLDGDDALPRWWRTNVTVGW